MFIQVRKSFGVFVSAAGGIIAILDATDSDLIVAQRPRAGEEVKQLLHQLGDDLSRMLGENSPLPDGVVIAVDDRESSLDAAVRLAAESIGWRVIDIITAADAVTAYQGWVSDHERGEPQPARDADQMAACGTALRAAAEGRTYVFLRKHLRPGAAAMNDSLELRLTSPASSRRLDYTLAGQVRAGADWDVLDGGSLLVHAPAAHCADEVFFDAQGRFEMPLELIANRDNPLAITLCDAGGQPLAEFGFTVRQGSRSRAVTGAGTDRNVLATGTSQGSGGTDISVCADPESVAAPMDLVQKPIRVEVLGTGRRRVPHVLVPAGAAWPGPFTCTCRTADNSGRIVLPLFEDERLLQTITLRDLGAEVPLAADVELQVLLEPDAMLRLDVALPAAGRRESFRFPLTAAVEPPAVEEECGELKPDWSDFARLVKDCLILGGEVADRTGRNRQELFEQIYTQERYAEEAHRDSKVRAYQECFLNLMQFAQYLEQLQQEYLALLQGGNRPPNRDDVLRAVRRLERELTVLEARVPASRSDVRARIKRLHETLPSLGRHADRDLTAAVAEVRKAFQQLDEIQAQLGGRPGRPLDTTGLLAAPT